MAAKTHWRKVVSDPIYLGEADFDENEEKIVTIKSVSSAVTVKTAEGSSSKAVVYFQENVKPMILNVARSKAITKVAGSPYFEDWIGQMIQLYIDPNVKAFGEVVSAVRVRPRKPVVKQAVKCADCGNPITAAAGKGADYIAQYTKQKFGVSLCLQCGTKRSEQAGGEKNDTAKAD